LDGVEDKRTLDEIVAEACKTEGRTPGGKPRMNQELRIGKAVPTWENPTPTEGEEGGDRSSQGRNISQKV